MCVCVCVCVCVSFSKVSPFQLLNENFIQVCVKEYTTASMRQKEDMADGDGTKKKEKKKTRQMGMA